MDYRDKKITIYSSILLCFFLVAAYLIFSGYGKIMALESKSEIQAKNIIRMQQWEKELKTINPGKTKVGLDPGENFHISAFLEQLAASKGIQDQIVSMKILKQSSETGNQDNGSGDIVEVKLKDIALTPLADFLFDIERSGKSLTISKIHIRQLSGNQSALDVVLFVSLYRISGEPRTPEK
jgi:hypothetical protein